MDWWKLLFNLMWLLQKGSGSYHSAMGSGRACWPSRLTAGGRPQAQEHKLHCYVLLTFRARPIDQRAVSLLVQFTHYREKHPTFTDLNSLWNTGEELNRPPFRPTFPDGPRASGKLYFFSCKWPRSEFSPVWAFYKLMQRGIIEKTIRREKFSLSNMHKKKLLFSERKFKYSLNRRVNSIIDKMPLLKNVVLHLYFFNVSLSILLKEKFL